MNKHRGAINNGLSQIGAAWATRSDKYVSPDDPPYSKPTYHIHPDASQPWVTAIIRFSSLKQIDEYIKVRKEIRALWATVPEGDYAGVHAQVVANLVKQIMNDFWESLNI